MLFENHRDVLGVVIRMAISRDNNVLINNLPVVLYKIQDGSDTEIGSVIVLVGSESTTNLPIATYDMEEDVMDRWQIQVDNANVSDELKIDQRGSATLDSKKIEDMYLILTYVV